MCVSQRRWTGCRGRRSPAPPLLLLLLLPLSFLTSTPPLAQGAIHIPPNLSQPPVLTEMPISYTAFSREDINLPCEASGNPTPTFRWLKDGQVFGVEHNATGTLRADGDEPLEAFEGRYRCYAANLLGTAMTQAVEVIVEPQPVLLKQHRLLENAREGDSIVLSCNPPNSSTPPNIHWMDKKMVHIQQSDRVMVGLDGNLYFSNLLPGDSKDDYICHAQYSAARTILPVTAVTLSVAPSNNVAGREPSFFRLAGPHSSVLALREQSVTLECIPNGLPTPKVEWKKKDGSLKESTGHLESHNRHLHFRSIALEDDGEYECTATNDHKEIKHSFTVTVEAAPYWVKKPQNLLYAPGETVRLDCQAEGIPTPDITWSMNGVKVTDLTDEPRRSVSGGVLILMDVKFEDTAVFQCEATNKHGSILLNTYLYVIELPPQILSSDGVVYRAIEGGSVRLNCESFGSPRPHVTWSGLDGLHLLSDPRVSLLTNGTVELSDITRNDSGSYVCSVQHTNISITAHLEVFDPTVMLSGPQDVQARRGSSALLDCEFYKDPLLVQHQIIWRKGEHKLLKSAEDDKYTVFENGTLKVTNIQFNDNAHYSCEVITDLDHVRATGSITVVDRPEPPKELSLTPDVNGNVTLSWIPGHSHNSPITEYIVEVREEQHTEAGHWRWEELQRVSGQNNYLQLRLRPFSTYRFRVIAVNLVGESKHSELSEHHSTPPTVPVQNPTNVRSESTDPKTLVITWDEMDRRDHNGPGFMYQVSWREAGAGQWTTREVLAPPLLVNDTGTYTPFDIKVQAVNSLGSGPKPKATIGHSGEEPPEEAPTGLSTNVMNTTVRVLWKPAQNVRGLLQGYKIYVQRLGPSGRSRRSLGKLHHKGEREARSERDRGRDGEEEEVVVVYGGDTWKDVVGLKLYSHYKLTVSVFNSVGESPRSLPHHFHTPEGAPGPPASLRFESPSEKSLILYWTPPVEPNGVLLGYMVQYKQDDSRDSHWEMETISDPANTHFEFTSLDPSSYYIFKVIANTATGDGPPITRRAATLLEGVPPSNITIVSGNTSLNLSWVPGERDRNHGFHIHYLRKSAGSQWQESEVVNSTQGFYSLSGLHPGSQYELMIINGNSTQWKSVAWTMGPVPSEMPGGFAAQGWLIGLISAIVLLVLILLILCLIKRSKGGKYAVKDKEDKEVDSEARPMKDETFGEYSDGDEKRSDSQPSLCGDSKLGSDDSLAEYGDSVDIQFNEDGSFIGQYSGRGPVPHGNESSGPASPVNAVPPPPIAPSMSSILNRPS